MHSWSGEVKDDMVFSSDLLDALTQDFFARKGNSVDNEPLYVEDIKVGQTHILCSIPFTDKYSIWYSQVQSFSDRPGYERTSSSLWKQREEHCAKIIQTAWRDHYNKVIWSSVYHIIHMLSLKVVSKRKSKQVISNGKPANPRTEQNGKKLIEVQPSPSPEN